MFVRGVCAYSAKMDFDLCACRDTAVIQSRSKSTKSIDSKGRDIRVIDVDEGDQVLSGVHCEIPGWDTEVLSFDLTWEGGISSW